MDTFARGGVETDMGPKLLATFLAAGLPAPQMISAGRAEGGSLSPAYDYVTETLRSLLPAMERLGVATAAEVDIDTLAGRLREEAVIHTACLMLPPLIGAWTSIADHPCLLQDNTVSCDSLSGATPPATLSWG